jgi:adenosylhomocysteine nucleosidase
MPRSAPEKGCKESPRLIRSALVTFAVPEEARFFVPPAALRDRVVTCVTGMGRLNAVRRVESALQTFCPDLVLTCGFAGGLNRDLTPETVIYSGDCDSHVTSALQSEGARPVRFLCTDRVLITALEKQAAWRESAADAVEMESEAIQALCRARGIACLTVRVISDAAGEDLPLDFNALMTADQKLSFPKLIRRVLLSPWKVPGLLRLHTRTRAAARRLGQVLSRVLERTIPLDR